MLLEKVQQTIHKYRMFRPGEKVVVAVSGGPDSVALLHLLWRLKGDLGVDLHVAHLDHRLREEESRADAAFVLSLAKRLGLQATVESRDVLATWRQTGGSIEEVARRVRYEFLERVAERVGGDKIATGHHADDQAETVLLWLVRGAGTAGLAGIPGVRSQRVARPLIEIRRAEIEEYLNQQGLNPCQDSSNLETTYLRNKIRWKLLPLLKEEFNPNIVPTLGRSAVILRDEDECLEEQVSKHLAQVVKKNSGRKLVLDIDALLRYHVTIRRRMIRRSIRMLKGSLYRIGFDHIQGLLELAEKGPNGRIVHLPERLSAERTRDGLIVKRGSSAAFHREVKVPGQTEIPEIEAELKIETLSREAIPSDLHTPEKGVAYFDGEIKRWPLYVRNRRRGDRFQPLGMKGSKKLKGYFIDQKVPRLERDEIPILTAGDEIVWVVGWRPSERFKVTDKTETVLKVNFLPRSSPMALNDNR